MIDFLLRGNKFMTVESLPYLPQMNGVLAITTQGKRKEYIVTALHYDMMYGKSFDAKIYLEELAEEHRDAPLGADTLDISSTDVAKTIVNNKTWIPEDSQLMRLAKDHLKLKDAVGQLFRHALPHVTELTDKFPGLSAALDVLQETMEGTDEKPAKDSHV